MRAQEYQVEAARTSRINWKNRNGPDLAILGIIGELGSLASAIKKHFRDKEAYAEFENHVTEELGDILWYLTTSASHLNLSLEDWPKQGTAFESAHQGVYSMYTKLTCLIREREELLSEKTPEEQTSKALILEIIFDMQGIAQLLGTDLDKVARSNCDKILSYWCDMSNQMPARKFDSDFPDYEQLPRQFEIEFVKARQGKSMLIMMNGIALGDRLTDNSYQDDGYRFHDVFHLAGVATLGWSPVVRRMLKRKRKTNPTIDEVEDGARAAIIEEAIINHIYDYARPTFLKGAKRVDLDLIKRIQNLVKGYEVAECEPWEWQDCIMKSYRIFRQLREVGEGTLIIDAETRSIELKVPES